MKRYSAPKQQPPSMMKTINRKRRIWNHINEHENDRILGEPPEKRIHAPSTGASGRTLFLPRGYFISSPFRRRHKRKTKQETRTIPPVRDWGPLDVQGLKDHQRRGGPVVAPSEEMETLVTSRSVFLLSPHVPVRGV
jgi:hypothetical protein